MTDLRIWALSFTATLVTPALIAQPSLAQELPLREPEWSKFGADELILDESFSQMAYERLFSQASADSSEPAESGTSIREVLDAKKNPAKDYGYVSLGLGFGIPNNIDASQNVNVNGFDVEGQLSQSLDLGFAGEIAGGYQFQDARVELAVGYGTFGTSGGTANVVVENVSLGGDSFNTFGEVHYLSVFINGYYDIRTDSKFRPYLGVGIGYMNVGTGDISLEGLPVDIIQGGNVGVFGYQGKFGLSYEVFPKGTFFAEAGYIGTASFSVNSVNYDPLGAIKVAFGWRQGF
ncbi:MAG: P44/Msp2 family outer membrane protein [Cyanobacteria bacterium RI_101]|nr:P44/Msp2 family outer membrane protein [Cyanobacteria bacterium RI_101]